MLQADPALCEKALAILARWDQHVSVRSKPLRDRWVEIISERDWASALDESERGNQLRQASPLAILLPENLRLEIMRKFYQDWAAAEAESAVWENVAPIGREFGSPDYERLEELDHYACLAHGSLAAARNWLDTPNTELGDISPEDLAKTPEGFERVLQLLKSDHLGSSKNRSLAN